MDDIRFTGHWWLDNPSTSKDSTDTGAADRDPAEAFELLAEPANGPQPGILTIAADGKPTLELIGGFDLRKRVMNKQTGELSISFDEKRVPLIYGIAAGQPITLINCVATHSSYQNGIAPSKQTLAALRALIGLHLGGREDAAFQACHLRLENLQSFLRLGAASFGCSDHDGEHSARITTPTPISIEVEGYGLTAEMWTSGFNAVEEKDVLKISASASANLSISSKEARSYQGFDDITMAIVDLLTLASDEACGVISKRLVHKDPLVEGVPHLEGGQVTTKRMETMQSAQEFAKRVHYPTPGTKAKLGHDFLFTCADVSFEEIVSRWVPLRAKVRLATNMLFGLRYAKPQYLQTQVLTVAVAAEALSRCLNPDAIPMQPRDFERLLLKALKGLEPDDRARFEHLVRNEPTYKDRLLDLASIPSQATVGLFIPDRDQWANDLRDVRNGLAHALAGRGDGVDLKLILERTRFLLHLVLMEKLGLPEEVQMRAAKDNQYLMYLHRE